MKQREISHFIFLIIFYPLAILAGNSAESYLEQAAQAIKQKNGIAAKKLLVDAYVAFPTNTTIISQLASLYYLLQEYEQAALYFEKLVALSPDNQTHYNLGATYCKLGRFTEAIKEYEPLMQQFPHEPIISSALLKLYVRTKQFKKAEAIVKPNLCWFDENIYGKTILLDLDKEGNGFGDGIMFIRYARRLEQAGARIVVKAPKPLVPLLSRCPYIASVITKSDQTPPCDKEFGICIVSLMCKSKYRIAMNLPETPYLTADPALIAQWRQQLSRDTNFKVGLCWESNFVKNSFTGAIIPSPRAINLASLKPIALPGISFYSLQKKSGDATPFAITQFDGDFDESHGRFMDTAALIMNCDLIISVDTSIAHLAGALGKPTWLLLNCESDYRWFTQDSSCYWYSSMRLFRQQQFGNWAPVVAQVKAELEKREKNHE